MKITPWLQQFRQHFSGYKTRKNSVQPSRLLAVADSLEQRCLLTVFTVNSLLDGAPAADGALTLREAIEAANLDSAVGDAAAGDADGDVIQFAPSVFDGSQGAIELNSTLGELFIIDDLTIDATRTGSSEVFFRSGPHGYRTINIDTDGFQGTEFSVALIGMSIQGDTQLSPGDDGGGLLISDGEDVSLTDVSVTFSTASGRGGGIFNGDGTLLLDATTVDNARTEGGDGGGIFNDGGIVTVQNGSVIRGNDAQGGSGNGGGIFSDTDGTIIVLGSEISGNTAAGSGGGIASLGDVTVVDSLISGNESFATNTSRGGGGIYGAGSASITVTGSEISSNTASSEGGGIRLFNASGLVTVVGSTLVVNSAEFGGGLSSDSANIRESTFSGNTAEFSGGGLFAFDGDVSIINSTLSGNTAGLTGTTNGRGGGVYSGSGDIGIVNSTIALNGATGSGGGVYVSSSNRLTAANTIFAANTDGGTAPDLRANGATVTFSLIGDNAGSGFAESPTADATTGNIVGSAAGAGVISPGLGALQDNGGSTQTHALLSGSFALESGDNVAAVDAAGDALTTDQRGFLRTVGTVDIGAVEMPFAGALIVSTATDVVDGDYSFGELSLREAVIAANQRAGADTITFASGMANQQIQLDLGELLISEDVSIQGLGSSETVIVARDIASAADNSRLIHVTADGGDVTLVGLTLAAGKVGAGENGGGILFESMGTLTVSNAVIAGNEAESQSGGGIYSSGGAVVVTDSEIVGNNAQGSGGGIASLGDVTVVDSLISGNGSFATSTSLGGGGIFVGGSGQITVTGSEISSNTSSGEGGGIRLFNTSGSVTIDTTTISGNSAAVGGGLSSDTANIRVSTISGNTAQFSGGGLFAFAGEVSIINSTLTGNTAGLTGTTNGRGGGVFSGSGDIGIVNSTIALNGATGSGGGVYVSSSNRLTAANTIFAANTDGGTAPDLRANGATVTFSLIGDNAGSGFAESPTADATTGNIVGSAAGAGVISPGLGALQDNGGSTQTHALLSGSFALESGDNVAAVDAAGDALTTDQRGFLRTVGTVDIGAVEMPFAGDLIVSTATDVVDGDYSNGELSLREAVIAANQRAGADTITFASGMANQQIQLDLGELLISEDVSIQGLGSSETVIVARDIASAADNSRLIHVTADGGDVTLVGLTLAAGKVGAGENGGGILFESMGTLTVSNAVIAGNEAESQSGGGIYSSGGAVVVTDSEIVGNNAQGSGGGIASLGDVTVVDSLISGNGSFATSTSLGGGGIFVGGSGQITVTGSEISSNTSSGEGGGIRLFNTSGSVTVDTTTISGNSAVFGGGVSTDSANISNSTLNNNDAELDGGALFTFAGIVSIVNTTMSGNNAGLTGTTSGFGGGVYSGSGDIGIVNSTITLNAATSSGGGVYVSSSNRLTAANTIFAANTDGGTAPDLRANGATVTFSLIGDNPGSGFAESPTADATTGNIVGSAAGAGVISAGLGTLQDNGGPTLTHALLFGSPAIDAGSNALAVDADSTALISDQRGSGFARQIDGNLDSTATVDIGAFEFTAPVLTVAVTADSFSENGGSTTATVSRSGDTSAALTVNLSSDDTSEATVPGTVTIAAGQTTSPAFTITAVDDSDVDGTQTATITASVTGAASGSDTVDVTDNESSSLTVLIVAASVTEGGSTTATVTRNGDTSVALTVNLSSDDTSEATVPGTVTIAAGQTTSPAFTISAADDSDVDGTQTATITASATGLTSGNDTVDVTDNESASLTVSIVAASVTEGGSTTATVTRNGDTSAALTVNLSSDDTSEATVPGTVTIAAGQATSPAFTISAADDSDVDGTQTATITASATGLTSDSDSVDVTDNDVVAGNQQDISSDSATKSVVPGGTISVPVIYRTLDENGTPVALQASLISFNLHFDSSALTFVESTDIFAEGIQVVPNSTRLESDAAVTGDDNDSATGDVLIASYSDTDSALNIGWPNTTVVDGQVLYVAHFRAADDFTGTTVNFSANAVGTVVGESEDFGFSSESVTVGVSQNVGNVDGDDDFDANDAFLIQLVQLAGSNTQIDQSKGASALTAAQIRANIAAIGLAGDVDGDSDFDANDSFLIQLVKLAGSNTQIDQSKGASPLSATQIRANVDSLGGGNAGQRVTASLAPQLASVSAESEQDRPDLFTHASNSSTNAPYSTPSTDVAESDEVWTDFRSWIDAL